MRALPLLLVPLLPLGAGAWAAFRSGLDLDRSLEEGGRALARGMAEAALGAEEAVEALQRERADRLLAAARRLDGVLQGDPVLDAPALAAAAAEARARRAILLGPDQGLLALGPPDEAEAGPGSATPDRLAALEAAAAAETARRLPAEGGSDLVEGLGPNPFGTGTDLRAALRRASGQAIVLRARGDEIEGMRRAHGLPALLLRAAAVPGVRRAAVETEGGAVLEERRAGGAEVEEGRGVRAEAPLPGGRRLVLEVSAAGADLLREGSRRAILLAAAAVGVLAAAAALLLRRADLRHAERERRWAEEVERERRMAAVGDLGAGLAHQIRNPLNGISLAVQRLRRSGASPALAGVLAAETARLDALVAAFLRLSREARPRLAPGDPRAVLDEAAARVAAAASARGVPVVVEAAPGLPRVSFDREFLLEAIENLARNAVEESPPGEPVVLRALPRGGGVALEVEDRGPGIPPGLEGRIFERFATTKPGGTGLGLAFAHRLVALQGGALEASGGPGRTVFTARFPGEAP